MRSTELGTILSDVADQKAKLNMTAAKAVAEYVKSWSESGDSSGIYRDILKMTKDFSAEDQAEIFAMALEISCRNMGNIRKTEKAKNEGGSFKGGSSPKRKSGSNFGFWD